MANEIRDELKVGIPPTSSNKSYSFYVRHKMVVLISLIALLIALYMGILLFGKNSFEVFMRLEDEEIRLQADIERLKAENAKLQKSFFEQQELLGKGKE